MERGEERGERQDGRGWGEKLEEEGRHQERVERIRGRQGREAGKGREDNNGICCWLQRRGRGEKRPERAMTCDASYRVEER